MYDAPDAFAYESEYESLSPMANYDSCLGMTQSRRTANKI